MKCGTSETLLLTWSDIDWDLVKMLIRSPKTAHHSGRESRFVPIFPGPRPYLMAAFDEAGPGTTFVVTRYRKAGLNLRTHLMRIIAKAGLKPWPKLFQNLRATRETELVEQWPEHIARKHYLQATSEHFEQAAQICTQQGAAKGCNEQETHPQDGDENAVLPLVTADCKSLQDKGVGRGGLEPPTPAFSVRCSTN